jgi:tripartite-type tricarboxylate transporter receptor subunit TctC
MRRRDFTYLLAGLTLLSSSLQARADEWPSHAIRIIVPFGAGGAGDTLARIVAQHLSESLGQPFIVEDRLGPAVFWEHSRSSPQCLTDTPSALPTSRRSP